MMRLPICLMLLIVSGCGFQPMYGARYQNSLSAGIAIEAPKDAAGQQFQQDLEDQLNPEGVPPRPKYRLNVQLTYASGAIGVARDGTVSRFNVTMNSSFVLTRISDNVVVERGDIHHVSSYNNQANQYFSTYVSERDSIKRGITELAGLYRQRIGALLVKEGT